MHRKQHTGDDSGFPTISVSRLALCEANCKKPVYTMHKWWARRLGVVFRMLLLAEATKEHLSRAKRWSRFYSAHTLPAGFTVLDPFLGGGTSLIEAAKLGAHCIGVDIDPVACFVSEQELCGTDPSAIFTAFNRIKATIGEDIAALYRSRVNGKSVDVIYFFWVDSVTCPKCNTTHDGHPTFQLSHSVRDGRQTVICPHCGGLETISLAFRSWTCSGCDKRAMIADVPVDNGVFSCPTCQATNSLRGLYSTGRVVPRLFAKEYLTREGKRGFALISKADLELYNLAEQQFASVENDLPLPKTLIPTRGRFDARPLIFGYRHYRELFNSRQLYCLGLLAREIANLSDPAIRKSLALAFSHCLASNNMFCGYAFGYRRLTPLFSVHSYRKISRPVEGNVLGLSIGRGSFTNCVKGVMEGCEYMRRPYELRYKTTRRKPVRVSVLRDPPLVEVVDRIQIFNRSSQDLSVLQDKSVDLILSDPPYFDNLPYSELSEFYHVWLRDLLGSTYLGKNRVHTPLQGSLFAGRRTRLGTGRQVVAAYTKTLTSVLRECHRVAKDDARFVFTFHHRDSRAWRALGTSLFAARFRVRSISPVRSEGRSGLHSYSGTIKWDSIFICEKARRAEKRIPRPTELQSIATSSWLDSAKWQARIRQAGLDFGWADRGSLAMSLVLHAVSSENLPIKYLGQILNVVENQLKRLQSRRLTTFETPVSGDRIDDTATD